MGLTFSCKTAKKLAVKIDKFQPLVVKKVTVKKEILAKAIDRCSPYINCQSAKILTVSRESRQLIDSLIKQLFCPNLNFQKLNEIILELGSKAELLDASESRPVVSIRRRQSSSILFALFLDILIFSNIPSFLKLS